MWGFFRGNNLWGQVGIFDTADGDFDLKNSGDTDQISCKGRKNFKFFQVKDWTPYSAG